MTFYYTAFTPRRCHYDNCQFYFAKVTIGTRVSATKGEQEETSVLDLLDHRHSGDPIIFALDANKVGVRYFTSRAAAVSSKTS